MRISIFTSLQESEESKTVANFLSEIFQTSTEKSVSTSSTYFWKTSPYSELQVLL